MSHKASGTSCKGEKCNHRETKSPTTLEERQGIGQMSLMEGEHKEWKETQGREADKRINGGRMARDGTEIGVI